MPDTAQQTYIKVAADGSITYDFDGHITADGLDLLAGNDAAPPDDRKIRWLRESDGALVAELSAYQDGISGSSAWIAKEPDNPTTRLAYLNLTANTFGRSQITAGAARDANADAARILDSDGRSDFVRIGAAKKSRIGSTTITWPGGQAWQTSPAIVHNWNIAGGVRVYATAREFFAAGGNVAPLAISGYANGANQLNLIAAIGQGFGNPPAGAVSTVDYLLVEP